MPYILIGNERYWQDPDTKRAYKDDVSQDQADRRANGLPTFQPDSTQAYSNHSPALDDETPIVEPIRNPVTEPHRESGIVNFLQNVCVCIMAFFVILFELVKGTLEILMPLLLFPGVLILMLLGLFGYL